MKFNEKESQSAGRSIYVKSAKEWVPVSEEVFREYTRSNDTYCHRMKANGLCNCPSRLFWLCDSNCSECEFRCDGSVISLDAEHENGDGDTFTLYDTVPNGETLVEDIVVNSVLLAELIKRLRELDPEGDVILRMWASGASDREIARRLGRPQRTFARQMKRFRDGCKRMRDEYQSISLSL